MTTPNQPAPDGAFVIGGNTFSYGQSMDDQSAATLMLGSFTTIGNPTQMLATMADTLATLPLEVLQLFAPMIPGIEVFTTVAEAVSSIVDYFSQLAPMLLSAFTEWVSTVFQQLLDILSGLVVDPLDAAFGLVGDFIQGLFGRGNTNSTSIANLEAIVLSKTGTNVIAEKFDGPAGDLASRGWTDLGYAASYPARIAVDGSGSAVLAPHGSGVDLVRIALLDDPDKKLESSIQAVTVVFKSKMNAQGNCGFYAPLLVNPATDPDDLEGVYVKSSRGGSGGRLDLGIQLDGVATDLVSIPGVDDNLVAATGLAFTAADKLYFSIGDPDPTLDPVADYDQINWRWRAALNNSTVLDTVWNPETWNPAAAALLGSTYRCPAIGMAGAAFFGTLAMPIKVEEMAWYTPAA